MPGCPNSTQSGCRCPEHHPGLSEFATDPVAFAHAVGCNAQPALRLTLVTMGKPEVCHGFANGCICSGCALRAEHGGNVPLPAMPTHQPWEPRPARRRAA